MSTVLFKQAEAATLEDEVRALSEKLDRVATAVESMDRRREELEELVTDLMPAVNGALSMAMRRLDALEKSGVMDVARTAGQSLEVAATTVDPNDLAALASQAGDGVRTLRTLTAPDVLTLTERSVGVLRDARKGRPKTFWQLFRTAREPRVRRGLGAMMEILKVLGEGVSRGQIESAVVQGGAPVRRVRPLPRPASSAAARPASSAAARPVSSAAARPAASASAPAGASPNGGQTRSLGGQTRSLGGELVRLDPESFLVDRDEWTPEVAEALAKEAGLDALTDEHWRVIDFCRKDAGENGAAPGMRRITSQLGVPARDLYRLFPGGPGILAARIAGLGKPKSCV